MFNFLIQYYLFTIAYRTIWLYILPLMCVYWIMYSLIGGSSIIFDEAANLFLIDELVSASKEITCQDILADLLWISYSFISFGGEGGSVNKIEKYEFSLLWLWYHCQKIKIVHLNAKTSNSYLERRVWWKLNLSQRDWSYYTYTNFHLFCQSSSESELT